MEVAVDVGGSEVVAAELRQHFVEAPVSIPSWSIRKTMLSNDNCILD